MNLVWAAAEYRELGWHHSREIFASAERLMEEPHIYLKTVAHFNLKQFTV